MRKNALQTRRLKKQTLCLLLPLMTLGACANEPPVAVSIKGDSYCDIAGKVRWSKKDTSQTIKQVHRENQKIDRVCRKKAKG